MKTNRELQIDVLDAIRWEPLLKLAEIGVDANDGIVTLSGVVDSYIKKSQAEVTAKKITGVRAVVEKIVVKFNNDDEKSDSEIATAVLNALKSNRDIPFDKIQVEVENGRVTLDGKLEWNHQKEAAQKSASNIDGIKVLTNNIKIETDNADDIEKAGIERAIERNWSMNNQDVQVYVSGNRVTLNGIVHSFYQKEVAERMAWNAPGVWAVNNELIIDYNE
ncbi:BON domain-containing protein [Mucilaginibacter flavidus]|uniref:BON domain-containing protein n=1 Tax=Mucilaginibacter flavidus TaxID=2949309 RepID=UPI0020934190|nr:BON domain-containing protein [Mucilaginibacter flavidus]MCO5946788.1 BON domain-containing protein [Mucilaginibacter flavidus]